MLRGGTVAKGAPRVQETPLRLLWQVEPDEVCTSQEMEQSCQWMLESFDRSHVNQCRGDVKVLSTIATEEEWGEARECRPSIGEGSPGKVVMFQVDNVYQADRRQRHCVGCG